MMRSTSILLASALAATPLAACVDVSPVPVTACDGGPCDFSAPAPGDDSSAMDAQDDADGGDGGGG